MYVGIGVLHQNLPGRSITSCNTVLNNMTKGTKCRRGLTQIFKKRVLYVFPLSSITCCISSMEVLEEFSLKSLLPSSSILSCDKFSFSGWIQSNSREIPASLASAMPGGAQSWSGHRPVRSSCLQAPWDTASGGQMGRVMELLYSFGELWSWRDGWSK